MTFKELRTLVEKYQQALSEERDFLSSKYHKIYKTPRTEEEIEKGLERIENLKSDLLNKIKPYMSLFVVPAFRLEEGLKQVYKDECSEIYLETNVSSTTIPTLDNSGNVYVYHIKTDLVTFDKSHSYFSQELFNFEGVQTNFPQNEEYFTNNHHKVNLWELLENIHRPDWKTIHEACWIAIEFKLRERKNVEISKQKQERSLLVKKLELLKDEKRRNLAIASMEKQIENIDKQIADFDESSDNVKVDNI